MANTLVSYPHAVRLNQITSLQLHWHSKVPRPLDFKCPFIHWTNRNVHWTFKCLFVHWTNRNVHWTFKCPFVQWTNRNVHWTFKCPFVHWTNRNVHWTFKCPFVQWTNRNVHWTFKCPFVQWTNGHCLMANTLVSYPHAVRLNQITSLQLHWHCKVTCPLDIQMSIRPLDKQKCPLDIQMSIRPMDEQKCPFDIQISIRPMDEWTNGHCLMASTLVSCRHGVRLSQITSLQLPSHCKHYMFIGHSNVHSFIGRTEMSSGHSNVHSSIGRTEMSIGHSNVHSSNGRTEMSIGLKYMSICPVDEQKCPFVQWTNRHCLMANALVYYPQAVRLSQITLLQLPWHCKRYMSIGHK